MCILKGVACTYRVKALDPPGGRELRTPPCRVPPLHDGRVNIELILLVESGFGEIVSYRGAIGDDESDSDNNCEQPETNAFGAAREIASPGPTHSVSC